MALPEMTQPPAAFAPLADPQALLSYLLTVSTNEPGPKVIMPVFIPPTPPALFPSSHASYESH